MMRMMTWIQIKFLFIFGIVVGFAYGKDEVQTSDCDIDGIWKEMERRLNQQDTKIESLTRKNVELEELVNQQALIIDGFEGKNEKLENRVKSQFGVIEKKLSVLRPDLRNEYSDWGCAFETINPMCISGTILLTNAYYGKYNVCSEACCTPDSSADCKELVSETEPNDWEILQLLCNGKSSCAYEYTGREMVDFEPGYMADYMEIFYDCLSEIEPLGFTVYAGGYPGNYSYGDIIRFEYVESNFGYHFDPDTYRFTCPVTGVYFFSISFHAHEFNKMFMRLVKGSDVLATAEAESYKNESDFYSHASAFVVVLCEMGEYVYAEAAHTSVLYSLHNANQFAGYLLYRY